MRQNKEIELMLASRESVMDALLSLLALTGDFVTIGRRNRDPETLDVDESPALFLVEHSETYERTSPSLPPKRVLNVRAVIYDDVGADETAIPSTHVNNALDNLDAALAPDNALTGACTLGGLVESVRIEGDVEKAPGDVTGKSLAVVPIKIVAP
jgi:hypothetical protein